MNPGSALAMTIAALALAALLAVDLYRRRRWPRRKAAPAASAAARRPMPIVIMQMKGDPVPDWLFHVDPADAESDPGAFTFLQDCAIIDRGADFLVVPIERPGQDLLHLAHARNIVISAATKNVALFTGCATFTWEARAR